MFCCTAGLLPLYLEQFASLRFTKELSSSFPSAAPGLSKTRDFADCGWGERFPRCVLNSHRKRWILTSIQHHSTICICIHANMACVQYQITSICFKINFIFQHACQNQSRCGKEHCNRQHNWGVVPGEALLPSLASAEQSVDLRWTMRSRDRRISSFQDCITIGTNTQGSSKLLNHLANLSKTSHTWVTVIKHKKHH